MFYGGNIDYNRSTINYKEDLHMRKQKCLALVLAMSLVAGGLTPLGADRVFTGTTAQAAQAAQAAQTQNSGVEFSKESGSYEESTLELSAPEGSEIYYTLDGSDPADPDNGNRILYQNAISLKSRKDDPNVLSAIDPSLFDAAHDKYDAESKTFKSTMKAPADSQVDKCYTVRATAKDGNGVYSDVVTNTYFVGPMSEHIEGLKESCKAAGKPLSVISISMDSDDLFDSNKGIYVKGDVFNTAVSAMLETGVSLSRYDARNIDANYKQKGKNWERETHIDYFETDGDTTTCLLQQDCGIRIQGNYSRSDYQKGFRLYARADYGKKNFKYTFFDGAKDDAGNVIDKFKTLTLRNGGNCAFTTKFSDAANQMMLKEAATAVETQNARPCVVYLDGEYWGLYVLQDDYTDNYMETKHGVNKDNVIVYKGDAEAYDIGYKLDEGSLPVGCDEIADVDYYYRDMYKFMAAHEDLSDDADYQEFTKMIDPESCLQYFALETWINNKWDWPGKNWSMWKTVTTDDSIPYADGRFRFMIYDVEFGGVSGSSDARANTVKESNLLDYQTGNKDKPNVRFFAYLMTNRGFRDRFCQMLTDLTDEVFTTLKTTAVMDYFEASWSPLLNQFFDRYPGSGDSLDALYGGYASLQCMRDFYAKRAKYIPKIVTYVHKAFNDVEPTPTPTAEPTQTPTEEPAQTPEVTETPVPPAETSTPAPMPPTESSKPSAPDTPMTPVATQPAAGQEIRNSDAVYVVNKDAKTVTYKRPSANVSTCVIPDSLVVDGRSYPVTAIAGNAFAAKKLTSVVIGKHVTSIGNKAFYKCKTLKKITIKSKKLKNVGKYAIKGISRKAAIKCPSSRKKAYKKLFTKKTGYLGSMKIR